MAFTDPIIAGEELTRLALKSDNYVPGLSGWRIARDGAAEFDNLGIRGNLWVPSITLGGEDLTTKLNRLPRGVLGWVGGYPTNATTTEVQIFATEVQVIQGRWYEVSLINVTPDVGNVKSTEFRLRRTADGSAVTNSSPIMAISLRLSQFELGNIRAFFGANYTGTMKLRASISSLDGQNVRVWTPGDGGMLVVYDVGITPPPTGTSGAGVPVRVLKEFTITAQYSKTFLGDGTHRTDGNYQYTMIAGDWSNGKGNQRGWCSFSASDVSTYLDDLINVPESDIVTAEIEITPIGQWKNTNNTGYCSLGFHNTAGPLPAGNEPGGGIPNVARYWMTGYLQSWLSLKPGGVVPSNFLNSIRDGYLNGFMVGNTFSGNDYCGIFAGSYYPDPLYNTPPRLHMKYYKYQ